MCSELNFIESGLALVPFGVRHRSPIHRKLSPFLHIFILFKGANRPRSWALRFLWGKLFDQNKKLAMTRD